MYSTVARAPKFFVQGSISPKRELKGHVPDYAHAQGKPPIKPTSISCFTAYLLDETASTAAPSDSDNADRVDSIRRFAK